MNPPDHSLSRRDLLIAGGGKMIDTANGYGKAEERPGEIIEALQARTKIFLATKYTSLNPADAQAASVAHSQSVLRTQKFDLLYAWGVNDAKFDFGLLRDLKSRGARCRRGRGGHRAVRRQFTVQESGGKPLPPFASELGIVSWAQFFLKFVLANPAIVTIVPGTGQIANLRDNLDAGRTPAPTVAQRQQMLDYWNSIA